MAGGDIILWVIPSLFMLSFAGLAYAISSAVLSGAESYSEVYAHEAERQLADIFFFIPSKRITELAWAIAVAVFLVFFLAVGRFNSLGGILQGLAAGFVMGGAALYSPKLAIKLLRQKRLRKFNEQLVDALTTMSNALRSGSSISQAIEHVARQGLVPISQEFAMFQHQLRMGVSFEDALRNMEERVGSEDFSLFVSSIEMARQAGGNLTDVFDRISHTIRERHRIEARVRMLTSQGRLQGIVVGLMPVFLAVAMFTIDPTMIKVFFGSPIGMMVAGAVVALEVFGALFIRKIVKIEV